ncbi:hypothetical protein CHS0354_018700 [Potamilus streckersoni]|uniref:Uncharacterized protein n=1 Tax=Potamilus streckersoni TaxID=2493646 RepID=A0AAE0SLH8_9BIVA|nr:hypothetical protein CHS0354_018700 [Potamilus streckersoni]
MRKKVEKRRNLRKLNISDAKAAWKIVRKDVVSLLLDSDERNWIALPYVGPSHGQCGAGYVILQEELSWKKILTFRRPKGILAGNFWDFIPSYTEPRILSTKLRNSDPDYELEILYQDPRHRKYIKVSINGHEILALSEMPDKNSCVDLGNYEDTRISNSIMYLIDEVLQVDRIKVEAKVGSLMDTMEFTAKTPVAFKACQLDLNKDHMNIKKIHRLKNRYSDFEIGVFDHFNIIVNTLLPNQAKYGSAAGDSPRCDDSPYTNAFRERRRNEEGPQNHPEPVVPYARRRHGNNMPVQIINY